MRIKRKLSYDNDGAVSVINIFIVLIIVGILFWQFAIPLIDDGQPTFTDFIADIIYPDEEDITARWFIVDSRTNVESALYGQTISMEEDDVFKIKLDTNAPYIIGSTQYIITLEISQKETTETTYTTIYAYTEPIGINGLFTNEFIYSLGLEYGYDYIVWYWLYAPSGQIINSNSAIGFYVNPA